MSEPYTAKVVTLERTTRCRRTGCLIVTRLQLRDGVLIEHVELSQPEAKPQ